MVTQYIPADDPNVPLTEAEIRVMLQNIDKLTDAEVQQIHDELEELERRKKQKRLQDDLLEFCKHIQSDFIVGKHHKKLAEMLMACERGDKDRVCVNMPPRHGKTQITSIYAPAWYIGRNPTKKVMLVSHTADLAVDFGRKVRNLIKSDAYREVFPHVELSADSKSAGRWNTSAGGEFYATGVGSALAGRGAHFLIIDDPHNEQDILSGNLDVFEKAYDWFRYGARTRLMPQGAVAVVHCMTGDTPVMRPNGSETPLKDIRPGDMVASYEDGEVVSRKVLNWANQGSDHIYTITMSNGNLLRGNERHPFLVNRGGVLTWVKVRDLKVGDSLVSITAEGQGKLKQNQVFVTDALKSKLENEKTQTTPQNACEVPPDYLCRKGDLFALLRDANDPQKQKLVPVDATLASTENATTGNTQTLRIARLVTTVSGRAKRVLKKVAINLLPPKDSVTPTQAKSTTGKERQKANTTAQIRGGITTLKCVTGWTKNSTTRWLRNRKDDVQYAVVCLKSATIPSLGFTTSSLLTTATEPARFEDFYATTAISSSETAQLKRPYSTQFSTCEIISITPDGVEEVFDIQVEGTENFIANGFVSHNTRWSLEDMTGRLVRDMVKDPKADQYEVVEFPAILDIKNEKTGEWVEKPLWPEFFDLKALQRTKASMPLFQWNAQYQQNPTAEEAAIIKREWWRKWKDDVPPECEYLIMSLDAAAETHNRADYTGLTTWGVFLNEEENAYNLILLNSIKERYEFPELKAKCLQEYRDWEPDAFIVEKKSAGVAIYQEMRRMGIPVSEFTPHRGSGDKTARLNSVADIVSSGMAWVPDTRWAEELVDEIASFPFGSNDDLVDSTVMAFMRFRAGGFIRLPTDEPEEVSYFKRRKGGYY